MKRYLDNLQTQWKAMAPQRRIFLVAVVATIAIGAYVVNARLHRVEWAVLYANVDDVTASDAIAKLDAQGVPYRLEGNGTRLSVPRGKLDATRIALASQGVTGQAVPAGFDEVFDKQGLSTTDFAQQVNYKRGLEGELARTLLQMEAISGARVQLSIPERSVFVGRDTQPVDKPTASVLVRPRRPLTQAEVDTVANLMASSVPGLTVDNVTIASTDGKLLKAAGSDGISAGSSSAMEVTQQYTSAMEQGLTALVRTMTGSNQASVKVNAELDFSTKSVESRQLDPDANVPTAEEHSTETWQGTGPAPGGVAGVDGGPSDVAAGGGDGSYESSKDTITYSNGGEVVTKTNQTTPTIKRLGIAVVIPPLAADSSLTTDQVEAAVRSAANLDDERGDSITVVEGAMPATEAPGGDGSGTGADDGLVTDPVAVPPSGISPLFVVVAAVVGALGVIIGGRMRRRRKAKRERIAAALAAAAADPTLLGLPASAAGPMGDGTKKAKKAKKRKDAGEQTEAVPVIAGPDPAAEREAMEEIKADLERILEENPESLASLLSAWMTK